MRACALRHTVTQDVAGRRSVGRIREELHLGRIQGKKLRVRKLWLPSAAPVSCLPSKSRSDAILEEQEQGHDDEVSELDRSRRPVREEQG